jgi:signal transduction histidine kinase
MPDHRTTMLISARRLLLFGGFALLGLGMLLGAAAAHLALPAAIAPPDIAPAAGKAGFETPQLVALGVIAMLGLLFAALAGRGAADAAERDLARLGDFAAAIGSDQPVPAPASRIAELRRAEETLSATATQLKRRHQALVDAVEQSIHARHSKSDFLAGMSHELRTPLNAVIGFAELLTVRAGARLEPRELGYIDDIIASGRHLLRVIEDLLEIARLETSRLRLREECVDLVDVVEGVRRMLQPTADAKQLTLIGETAPAPLRVLADASKLRQIVANLLSNAIKFTPAGGEIRVAIGVDGERRAVVSVADTGIGMTAAQIDRAVLPFTRATEDPYVASTGGLGLGLAIAKSLTELHQGELEIRSAAAHGTTVQVKLPAARLAA